MEKYFKNIILESTGASKMDSGYIIQQLWSNYGNIIRYNLTNSKFKSVVVKHVRLPKNNSHPRGWNTDISHERKVKSYQVETAFYNNWADKCNKNCVIPKCIAMDTKDDDVLIVLEDLDQIGYPVRKGSVNLAEIKLCLRWLANFHGIYLNKKPVNLWEKGTYWHLDTRPDELEALTDYKLKNAAEKIDRKLDSSPFKTFVHGDAKLANFCFSEQGDKVSALDFQYVGGGVGVKDVAYFIGSCLYEDDCEKLENELLDCYFKELKIAVKDKNINIADLEYNWRKLYPFAWTDFHRFLKGWSPGHWKINSYSERLTREVLKEI